MYFHEPWTCTIIRSRLLPPLHNNFVEETITSLLLLTEHNFLPSRNAFYFAFLEQIAQQRTELFF